MKTSVEIDEAYLDNAKRILKTRTIRETIESSLREVIRHRALELSAKALGTIDLKLTPETVQKQRRSRSHVLG